MLVESLCAPAAVCVWAEWKPSLFNVSVGPANELSLSEVITARKRDMD